MLCEGTATGPCPNQVRGPTVKLSQGDLMLCPVCREITFPSEDNSTVNTGKDKPAAITSAANIGTASTPNDKAVIADSVEPTPIICELLCFVSNKINSMPFDMLLKLCTDFYDSETIEKAKDTLYDTAFKNDISSVPRKIKRRGDSKKVNDIQDILNIFLELPVNDTPCYVSKDLGNLPPLSMNNFDIASLIRSVETLKIEVKLMQEAQSTVLEAQASMASLFTQQRVASPQTVVKQVASTNSSLNAPLQNTDRIDVEEVTEVKSVDNQNTIPKQVLQKGEGTTDGGGSTDVNQCNDHESVNEEDGNVTVTEQESSDEDNPDDLLELARIQRHPLASNSYSTAVKNNVRSRPERRPKPRFQGTFTNLQKTVQKHASLIQGQGRNYRIQSSRTHSPKVNRRCVGIFISRLNRRTQTSDIITHVRDETGIRVQCSAIKTKFDTYKSFCIRAHQRFHKRLLEAKLWPVGTIVKEYLE